MSFRTLLSQPGTPTWEVALATHLGTSLPNETCPPDITPKSLARQRMEESFAERWPQRHPPTSGYNCFGQAFATRRTALYDPDVDLILSEDGYALIADASRYAVGDVVVYSDDRGPTHVARIVRFDERDIVLEGPTTKIPVVLSKFDDVSGEYEHNLEDTRWYTVTGCGQPTITVYRDRGKAPAAKPHEPSWRELVLSR